QARADRKRRLLQPLPRLRAECVRAGEPFAVAEQRQEAVALRIRPRVRLQLRDVPKERGRTECRLELADRGGLRVREDDTRHGLEVRLAPFAEDVRRNDL